jgi:hypothetical protein
VTILDGYYTEPFTVPAALDAFEAQVGRRPRVVMWYLSFGTAFPLATVQTIAARGQLPMISWMPDQVNSTNADIIAGTQNTYIDAFATAVKNYGGTVYIRLGFEMNGSWFQWGDSNFIGMWCHVQDRFRAIGVPNAVWVWAPNVDGAGLASFASRFPGVSRVDVLGLDGYNWGAPAPTGHTNDWRTFADVFADSVAQLRTLALGKPIWVTEVSSVEAGGDKAAWIRDMYRQVPTLGISVWVWFDADKHLETGEADWRVNTSAASLAAFRDGYRYASLSIRRFHAGARLPLTVTLRTSRAEQDITDRLRDVDYGSDIHGFRDARLSVAPGRPLAVDAPEVQEYGRVFITDASHGGVLWEGYQEDPGRSNTGDGVVYDIAARGPQARAGDTKAPWVYYDTALTERWTRSPGASAVLLTTVDSDASDTPGVKLALPGGQNVSAGDSFTGMIYTGVADAGGHLARVGYSWDGYANGDGSWRIQSVARATRLTSSAGDLLQNDAIDVAGGSTGPYIIVTHFTAGRTVVEFRIARINTPVNPSQAGLFGLLKGWYVVGTRYDRYGSEILTAAAYSGAYPAVLQAHMVVEDVLGRLCPTWDGPNAAVATNTFNIDKLAYFGEGATAEEILEDLMLLEPAHRWEVWESHPLVAASRNRFGWAPWPTSVRYDVSVEDAEYSAPASAADLYERLNLQWIDAMRRVRNRVRTQTVPALAAAGLSRQAALSLGDQLGSDAQAIQAGDGWLAEHKVPSAAGTLEVTQPILDRDWARMVGPHEVRAGGLVRADGLSTDPAALVATARDGKSIFRVFSTDYSTSGGGRCRMALDTDPWSVRTALARLQRAKAARRRR